MEQINTITSKILQAAFRVHTVLGAGLLESSYEECMDYEMKKAGLFTERQLGLPLISKK